MSQLVSLSFIAYQVWSDLVDYLSANDYPYILDIVDDYFVVILTQATYQGLLKSNLLASFSYKVSFHTLPL